MSQVPPNRMTPLELTYGTGVWDMAGASHMGRVSCPMTVLELSISSYKHLRDQWDMGRGVYIGRLSGRAATLVNAL